MNEPINTSRPGERFLVGLVIFVCALLVICCAVNLYFRLASASTEKPAPTQGAPK